MMELKQILFIKNILIYTSTVFFILLISIIFSACGNINSTDNSKDTINDPGPGSSSVTTLGTVWDMLVDSTAGDMDNDGLPDDIETDILGTDAENSDSDKDGISDFYELFGNGIFIRTNPVPDIDLDGIISALDIDDNDDGENDGELVDSDSDGIPDYLERYGYRYNWLISKYFLWNDEDVLNDPTVKYYKTDPLQPSTDQDPYSDSMEVSGLFMDVAVDLPGNLPMVPAYPDIVVKLERYEVTLNTDITTSSGKSLSQGETWNTDTYDTHTYTDESSWEAGVEANVQISLTDPGAGIKGHYNWGESVSDSVTTGTVKSNGGSTLMQQDWQTAKSINPTSAANIKLYLKVYNYGTACASNIIPTLTLRIGQRNIATLDPGNSQINLLEPGSVYPLNSDVYWVVDTIDTGASVIPVTLTLDELRALETGAQVDIVVTQVLADVLTMNESGHWETVGNWQEYMARVKSVSSELFFDIGDGNIINYLVYSGSGISSPVVTLRDALLWIAGGSGDEEGQKINYYDRINGGRATANLEGWSVCMNGETWQANKIQTGDNLLNTVLGPDTTIFFKAPKMQPPEIHYAYLDEYRKYLRTFVSDYHGISKVEFIENMDDFFPVVHEMIRDEGGGFYSYYLSDNYIFSGNEGISVTNLNEPPVVVSQLLTVIPDPSGIYPVIQSVSLNKNDQRISVLVNDNGGGQIFDVYLETLGVPELSNVPMTNAAGNLWVLDLPCGPEEQIDYTLIHAVNSFGMDVTSAVTEFNNYFYELDGLTIALNYAYDFDINHPNSTSFPDYNVFLDQSNGADLRTRMTVGSPTYAEYFDVNYKNGCRFLKMPADYDFDCLSRTDIQSYAPLMKGDSSYWLIEAKAGDVYIFYSGTHYAKIRFELSPYYPQEILRKDVMVFDNP